MIRTILIPLDGSAFSERALTVGSELAHALSARLVLVCVAGPDLALESDFTDGDQRAIAEKYAGVREEEHLLSTDPRMVEHMQGQVRAVAEAEAYLACVANRLAGTNIQVEVGVPYGPAAEGILTEIDLHSADLVIMSTHNRSGFSRMIGQSVTLAVIDRSRVPVMLVPPERL